MDHADHDPGTVAECDDCLRFAYEPGWYVLLRSLAEDPPSRTLKVPDADEAFDLRPAAARR